MIKNSLLRFNHLYFINNNRFYQPIVTVIRKICFIIANKKKNLKAAYVQNYVTKKFYL